MHCLTFQGFELNRNEIIANTHTALLCVHLTLTLYVPYEVSIIIMPIFQLRTLRPREWDGHTPSLTVSKWKNKDLYPSSRAPLCTVTVTQCDVILELLPSVDACVCPSFIFILPSGKPETGWWAGTQHEVSSRGCWMLLSPLLHPHQSSHSY